MESELSEQLELLLTWTAAERAAREARLVARALDALIEAAMADVATGRVSRTVNAAGEDRRALYAHGTQLELPLASTDLVTPTAGGPTEVAPVGEHEAPFETWRTLRYGLAGSARLQTADDLELPDPEIAWREHAAIIAGLRARGVVGHDAVVAHLALVGAPQFRGNERGARILLTGPPSSGKTHLLQALADTLQLPMLTIDAAAIVPEGWSGSTVSEVLHGAIRGSGRSRAEWEQGALLVLDEIDKATRAHHEDGRSTQVRRDRQYAMLNAVWGGTPILLTERGAASETGESIRTDRWLVVANGAFVGTAFATDGMPPTTEELVAWGMVAELATRWTTRLVLAPRQPRELIALLRADRGTLAHISRLGVEYGYPLSVDEGALSRVAHAMASGSTPLTLREGAQRLLDAALRRLLAAAKAGRPFATPLRVTADDLELDLRRREAKTERPRDEDRDADGSGPTAIPPAW